MGNEMLGREEQKKKLLLLWKETNSDQNRKRKQIIILKKTSIYMSTLSVPSHDGANAEMEQGT